MNTDVSGIIYAIFYSSAVQIASKTAPDHLQGMSQGIFTAVYSGIGQFVGSIVGGYLFDALGPPYLFSITSILTIFGVLMYCADIVFHPGEVPIAIQAVGAEVVKSEKISNNVPVDENVTIE